ncbi:hypothetical protein [Corynebacterium sp. HMSC04H06]|uniref:hypothetical protein n=1 Tax=Corynebacterium sp. HMSC04H06 TaxID=1581050 RepID=UPI0008A3E0A8|nr:hypothetical protein [Corynebacterium sp. HMSC04H06]OFS19328.1 hypothetical protein HMPREF3067_09855 [Corynebacterium sp. HMSC04H06]
MRRTRLSTTLVATAAVTFSLASPVAMADDAAEIPLSSEASTDKSTESGNAGENGDSEAPDGNGGAEGGDQTDGKPEDEEPDTMFGSSAEQTEKLKEVMSWVSVVGALLAGIVQATVMLARINPAILNPLKDLLKQAGVKF